MFYGDQRDQTRQFFFAVWQKLQNNSPLLPLEAQIADVMHLHPEYNAFFADPDHNSDADFSVETGQSNPFLHMGMHLALREQLGTNRPAGIQDTFRAYCEYYEDAHVAEHNMIETLGEILWDAQRQGLAPDEQRYLSLLKQRLPSHTV
ncbi:MAG: DUF1841 family protein [Gammaproteobacteria bacterium]|nr:DUF1841 family protein [Gammaproteobacteria bacterium]NNM12794.1 DUF1841 family protein [Gammaproteobacteria bacterium]